MTYDVVDHIGDDGDQLLMSLSKDSYYLYHSTQQINHFNLIQNSTQSIRIFSSSSDEGIFNSTNADNSESSLISSLSIERLLSSRQSWKMFCCNEPQIVFIICYVLFVILAFLTWRTQMAKPMRLIAVFIHEMSHAIGCWMTGGRVEKIEVNINEGGVTHYRGGCRCLIIPAGYVGTGFWAMIFVIMSGGRISSTIAACIFAFSLLISLCYSPNWITIGLNLSYALITGAFIYLEWFVVTPILNFVILFYGVFVGIFAIADINSDTISRTVNNSDAYACYSEILPCCLPKCIGIQWICCAVVFQWLGIYVAMVEMSNICYHNHWGWFHCMYNSQYYWYNHNYLDSYMHNHHHDDIDNFTDDIFYNVTNDDNFNARYLRYNPY